MKHLKLFQTEAEYTVYKNGDKFIIPNVSYTVDNKKIYYSPKSKDEDFIIMTYESNPAVMDVCYYQGWAASPDVMYKSEAEKVTDIGTAFKGLQGNTNTYGYGIYGNNDLTEAFTSFDEFKYFTGVTSIGCIAFFYCSNLTSITIPNSVTSIGNGAFGNCSSLTSITIPNSVTSIGDSVFANCTSLTSITIPDSVTSIGWSAFQNCSNLTSITIPDSVTEIGGSAFYNCSSLISVNIPNSVTSIEAGAFYNCTSLTSITIPDSVTQIGNIAFYGCTSLTGELVIPDSVTTIGGGAFASCSGMTDVTIGLGVATIGEMAFERCYELTSITCYAPTAPSILNTTFRDIKSNGTLYYPSDSDYSSWLSTDSYYLGYYNWTNQEI